MPSRRVERVSEAIREVVASAVLFEVADPRVQDVTVLSAEVSPDLRHATVRVSIMGEEPRQHLALRGLRSAAGFLQSKVAARLQTRYTPTLRFELDPGVKTSIAVSKLIDEALAEDEQARASRERRSSPESEAGSGSGSDSEPSPESESKTPHTESD